MLKTIHQQQIIVSWNPHEDTSFVVASNDLRYYSLNSNNLLHEDTSKRRNFDELFSLESVNHNIQNAKCLAWSPYSGSYGENVQLALGMPTGKVVLTNFQKSKRNVIKEFLPRHNRACNAISWSAENPNLIAAGLDKVRNDSCVMIWDVMRSGSEISTIDLKQQQTGSVSTGGNDGGDYSFHLKSNSSAQFVNQRSYELASEATMSLSWIPEMPKCLVVGTKFKWLRIYDLRGDSHAPRSVAAHSKSVQGVTFDPFYKHRFATYSEDGIIKIWDRRKFTEPTSTISTVSKEKGAAAGQISQIAWCPTQRDVLATITKDETCVKLWNVQERYSDLYSKPISFKYSRFKTQYTSEEVCSLSWHPKIPRRMMIACPDSGTIKFLVLKESSKISCSPTGDICYSAGELIAEDTFNQKDTFKDEDAFDHSQQPQHQQDEDLYYNSHPSNQPNQDALFDGRIEDVAQMMKTRVIQGFGMDIKKNKQISDGLPNISQRLLWDWAYRLVLLNERNGRTENLEFPGIHSILFDKKESSPFKPSPPPPPLSKNADWPAVAKSASQDSLVSFDSISCFPIYSSPRRSVCLQICGWDAGATRDQRQQERSRILTSLNPSTNVEREVAAAIFQLDLMFAIKILSSLDNISDLKLSLEKKNNYKFLAFALGGYSEERREMWREIYKDLHPKLEDPYLRSALAFLSCEPPDYSCVLNENDICLSDKVAFACRYLSDEELLAYLTQMKEKAIASGDLQGMILTGLTKEGMNLLQTYVDQTGDIQTASMLMSHVVPKKFKEWRVQQWLDSYKELLDMWKLWELRACLDISLAPYVERKEPPSCVVRCHFCNQPLVQVSLQPNRAIGTKSYSGSASTARPKSTSCPNCRKPLPRCAITLLPFGSPDASFGIEDKPATTTSTKQIRNGGSGSSRTLQQGSGGGANTPTSSASSIMAPGPGSGTSSSSGWGFNPDFNHWFSWCQTCKHGGNARDLMAWFSTHKECPVSGCSCRCFDIDKTSLQI